MYPHNESWTFYETMKFSSKFMRFFGSVHNRPTFLPPKARYKVFYMKQVATHLTRGFFKEFYVENQISFPEFKAAKMLDFKGCPALSR